MHKRLFVFPIFVLVLALMAAACGGSTDDRRSDPEAAQSFLPVVSGYTRHDVDSIADALSAAGVAGSALTGNLLGSAAIVKLSDVIQCYQDVGAVTAQIYVPQALDITTLESNPPAIGVVAVINETRLGRNLISCVTGSQERGNEARAAAIEPCVSGGRFTINNENISYLYAASSPQLCATFATHFSQYPGG